MIDKTWLIALLKHWNQQYKHMLDTEYLYRLFYTCLSSLSKINPYNVRTLQLSYKTTKAITTTSCAQLQKSQTE